MISIAPHCRPAGRKSWYFVKPLSDEGQDEAVANKEEKTQTKPKTKQGWHSAYKQRKNFPSVPIPKYDGDSDDSEEENQGKKRRGTHESAPSSKPQK